MKFLTTVIAEADKRIQRGHERLEMAAREANVVSIVSYFAAFNKFYVTTSNLSLTLSIFIFNRQQVTINLEKSGNFTSREGIPITYPMNDIVNDAVRSSSTLPLPERVFCSPKRR